MTDTKPRQTESTAPSTGDGAPASAPERTGDKTELRLEADVADKMDEAWRSKGIKNRMEFLRSAIGHYLTQLGARDVAALFEGEGSAQG